ncbi:hypothetical protein HZH68_016362 [Vespula germanica]|uniref:Uncharacterized protein n=1 Tax=Vespula germanica TaxID=30212 RepID=A0A834J2N7_VESGE|nr:hypothetical protein HZH68_016362 [Vespula germanica]
MLFRARNSVDYDDNSVLLFLRLIRKKERERERERERGKERRDERREKREGNDYEAAWVRGRRLESRNITYNARVTPLDARADRVCSSPAAAPERPADTEPLLVVYNENEKEKKRERRERGERCYVV